MTAALTVTILPAPAVAGPFAGTSFGTSSGFNLGSSTKTDDKSEELKEFEQALPDWWFEDASLNKLAQEQAATFTPDSVIDWGNSGVCPNCKGTVLDFFSEDLISILVYRVPKAETSDYLTWADTNSPVPGISFGTAVIEDDDYFYVFWAQGAK